MSSGFEHDWGEPPWGAAPAPGAAGGGTAVAPPPQQTRTPTGRRRRLRRSPLLFLITMIVAVIVGLIIGFILFLTWVVSNARGPIDATNEFVAALAENRIDDAHDSLCPETRADYDIDRFRNQMAGADRITGYTFISTSLGSEDGKIVSGTIDLDEQPFAFDFGVVPIDGEWRVCTYQPLDPDAVFESDP